MNGETLAMFIPIAGRFIVTEEAKTKKLVIARPIESRIKYLFLFENTLLYFIVGLMFGALVPFEEVLTYAVLAWAVASPIEYVLLNAEGIRHWLSRGDPPTKFEFIWVVYHSFWFLILAALIGEMLR